MAKEKAQGTEVVNPQPSQELEVPKARVLAEVFAPNGKIRVELLPEGAGGSAEGGSVDLQPLENRVAALEAKPEAEHVDLNPLSERVAALENAPKVADKSQEVTALQGGISTLQGGISTLQGTVAEHTTNIANNAQRITALESKPTPESVNLQALVERLEMLEMLEEKRGAYELLRTLPSVALSSKYANSDVYLMPRFLPFAVNLPEGMKAYTIDFDANQDLRNPTKFKLVGDGKYVPAFTPVIFMAMEPGNYAFSLAPNSKPIDTGLFGIDRMRPEDLDFDKFEYYRFHFEKNVVSFKRLEPKERIVANAAYVRIPKDYVYKPTEASATES